MLYLFSKRKEDRYGKESSNDFVDGGGEEGDTVCYPEE
jgi:hypothetical protein